MKRMVALITGASRGIGRCGALALAARGFDVAITGRTLHEGDGRVGDVVIPGSLDKTFEEVRALGREALPIGMDITERDSILSAYRTVIDTWGHVDALVNNAPYSGPGTDEKLLDIELEHAAALLAGNYLNQLYLTQHQALGADDRFSKGFHGAPPRDRWRPSLSCSCRFPLGCAETPAFPSGSGSTCAELAVTRASLEKSLLGLPVGISRIDATLSRKQDLLGRGPYDFTLTPQVRPEAIEAPLACHCCGYGIGIGSSVFESAAPSPSDKEPPSIRIHLFPGFQQCRGKSQFPSRS